MKAYSPIRTDLIIGMTLAELFLLILFVLWCSHEPGSGPEWKKIAEDQQHEIENLRSERDADKACIAELEEIEDFWQRKRVWLEHYLYPAGIVRSTGNLH